MANAVMILLRRSASLVHQSVINLAKNAVSRLVPAKVIVKTAQRKSVTDAADIVPSATKPAITIVRTGHPCRMPQCVKATLTALLCKTEAIALSSVNIKVMTQVTMLWLKHRLVGIFRH